MPETPAPPAAIPALDVAPRAQRSLYPEPFASRKSSAARTAVRSNNSND